MSRQRRFTTTIAERGKGRVFIPMPFDPDEAWGTKPKHYVRGSVGGFGFRGVILGEGDERGVVMGPAWSCHLDIERGTMVEVVVEPEGPQREDLAADVAAALDADPFAAEFWDSLAQFYRKGYLRWIDATKRSPETRAARITEMVELLKQGYKERPR